VTWKASSVYVAFIIALFAEMFGIPLTMFFFSAYLGQNNIFSLEFLLTQVIGQSLFYNIYHYIIYYASKIIIEIGIIIVVFGWKQIYYGARSDKLVTDGLYRYVRHPQYLGFLMVTGGLLLQWPSIFTAILYPVLVVIYIRLAKKEDSDVEKEFGETFRKYKESIPAFLPRIRKKAAPAPA
jgi:protein-S-isoprenylcysteine O-methyltransferase Ste14